jgi:hypothetical protein
MEYTSGYDRFLQHASNVNKVTTSYLTLRDPSSWENKPYTGKSLLLLSGQLKPTMYFAEINHQCCCRSTAAMSSDICSGSTEEHHNDCLR